MRGVEARASHAWKYVFASVRGTSHARTDMPCQDTSLVRSISTCHGEILIACASDGAGSASHGHIGSTWACETLAGEIADTLASGRTIADLTRADADAWCLSVHRCLAERASEEGVPLRQLACTLLGAVIGQRAAAFLQIGDGVIVIRTADDYAPVFWPQSGEYANTTYFITEPEALTHIEFACRTHAPEEFAILSDGLQHLALRFDLRAAHTPFFTSLFSQVRAGPEGAAQRLTEALVDFLDSPNINARTDDDKTLVLATRLSQFVGGDSVMPAPVTPPAHAIEVVPDAR